ncbi:MFS transporter [Parafilimonas sp.]|uniref:MFS transporter n=1 Tax=Parafilimonas sp. TaxID=1969739 RepID=UPI003F7CF5B1
MKQVEVNIEERIIIAETLYQPSAATKRSLAIAFIVCYISIMFSGISSMLMSVYLPVAVKDLLGSISDERMNYISAYINSIFIFGSMFGGFAWGFVCDKIGRSKAVIFSTALYALFTALTAFSSSWLIVGVYRFITGFGVGGVIVTTNILIAEIWPEKKRAIALGIVSAAMPVGFIVAGALNNLVPEWRNAFLAGIIPLITAVIAMFMLAEPESWKQANHAQDNNNAGKQIFSGGYRKNLVSGSIIFGAMLIGLWAIFSWAPTWVQSITPDNNKADELRGITMMILALSGLIGSVVSGWIVNRIGMRKTMMLCFAAGFIMTAVVFKLNSSITTVTLIEMGIMAFFFGISQGALSVYIPALFPTKVRASATGFCFNIGRLFTATVVFFIGALVSFLGGYGNAIFIFSFIFIIGLITTFRAPALKGEMIK